MQLSARAGVEARSPAARVMAHLIFASWQVRTTELPGVHRNHGAADRRGTTDIKVRAAQ
jgi:hypothetical protein